MSKIVEVTATIRLKIQGADPDDEDLEYVDEQEDTKEREIEEWNY
tara:strand:+ start:456 stop:590 length:135 start_codon:yes stop_codon:yes gene_type:complete